MADEALVEAIRKLLPDSPFHGEGHRKLWARLRFADIRTSLRRVLRLMRAHGLLAPQRAGRPRGSKAHDGTITTDRVDLMWGTDLTSVVTGEGQAAMSSPSTTARPSASACTLPSPRTASRRSSRSGRRCAGAPRVRQGRRPRPALRHDHGSLTSATTSGRIRFLGIASSPAFVREPEGNGCAERFIRTLKENVLWVRPFETVEELRLALIAFKRTYNQAWIIERHGYRTPARIRADQLGQVPMAT